MEFNKIAIDKGHNCAPDIGASAIGFEDTLTKETGDLVISYLKGLGKIVTDCTPLKASTVTDSLYLRTTLANRDNVELYVSIHFNIGGGKAKGCEVWAMSIKGQAVGQNVCNAIAELGFNNRGVKNGSELYVIRNTNAPAILIECCFLDNEEDMKRLNTNEMAKAIVYGITGIRVGIPEAPKVVEAPKEVNTGSLVNQSVLELQKKINRLGFTANHSKLSEDGIFGTYSMEAVKNLQRTLGLAVDGIAGDQTLGAINQILSKPLLKKGTDKVIPTRYLQWRLLISTDGVFGNDTERSLRKFQDTYKLDVDGICGNQTWKKLIG